MNDYRELIERLRTESLDSRNATLPIMDLCMDAAGAIETLTAQLTASEAARADLGKRLAKAEQELAQVKAERSWISVKDRLPDDGEAVLTFKNGITEVQVYEKRQNGWIRGNWFWSMATVSHWMPLPDPPEEAETELKGDANETDSV